MYRQHMLSALLLSVGEIFLPCFVQSVNHEMVVIVAGNFRLAFSRLLERPISKWSLM